MKRLAAIGMMACAVTTLAMPTKVELTKAQPIVNELMKPLVDDFKAKRKSAKEVAESAESFAKEAETEAAKLLLLRGAISYYSRSADYEKAADAVALLQSEVKDIPPETVAEIISRATSRISAKNAPRLYSQYRLAKALVKANKDMPRLEAALKKRPLNFAARREYAELLALTGDWKGALAQFAELKGKEASMAKAELAGKAKSGELGDFWWDYKAQSEDVADAIKAQAVAYYRAGLAANEITGLKKALAEKRIEEAGSSASDVADVASEKSVNESPSGCKFIAKGNEATMVFPNGVTIEFVKCPAGQFKMLCDYEKLETVPVKITRPFWFSKKYILWESVQAAFPERERYKKHKGSKTYVEVSLEEFEDGDMGMVARLNEDFKSFFPKGYVVRLTSMAEYEYAYHANTKDRKDPYYTNNQWDLSAEQHKLMRLGGNPGDYGIANKWGISGLGHLCWFLDRVDPATMLNDLKPLDGDGAWSAKYEMKKYCGKPMREDPFLWSESENALNIRRVGHMNIKGRNLAHKSKYGPFHLVIGPDLVSEWRAKNKKK